MHNDTILTDTPTPPASVIAHAVVEVTMLDDSGVAVAHIVEWRVAPSDADWHALFGDHSTDTPLPTRCTFIGGLPGERHEIDITWRVPRTNRRKRHAPTPHVRPTHILVAAPERTQAQCPVFGECGGCQLQHLAYEQQLRWKTQRVHNAFTSHGIGDVAVESTIGSADPWHYRNHMRFSINRDGQPGLTAHGTHHVLPLTACPIAHPLINRTLAIMSETRCRRPQLLVRCGATTGQVLLQPVPDDDARSRLVQSGLDVRSDTFAEALRIPVAGPQTGATGEQAIEFRVRPSSFFQTNTAQANQMAALVLAAIPTGPEATIVDAYCGVGTFAALLAPHVGKVIAIEESASAIRDAQWNLRSYANVEIVQAKTEVILPTVTQKLDALVIDPPRAGCQQPVLAALVARKVPRIVYVSCNPDTLARDVAVLCQADVYRIVSAQPLDMFPQTAHIETIVILEARS